MASTLDCTIIFSKGSYIDEKQKLKKKMDFSLLYHEMFYNLLYLKFCRRVRNHFLSMFCVILTLIAFIVESLPLQAFCSRSLAMHFIECHIQMLIMLHIVMKRANKCPPSHHIQVCRGLPCINLKDKTSIMLHNMYNLVGLFAKHGLKFHVTR